MSLWGKLVQIKIKSFFRRQRWAWRWHGGQVWQWDFLKIFGFEGITFFINSVWSNGKYRVWLYYLSFRHFCQTYEDDESDLGWSGWLPCLGHLRSGCDKQEISERYVFISRVTIWPLVLLVRQTLLESCQLAGRILTTKDSCQDELKCPFHSFFIHFFHVAPKEIQSPEQDKVNPLFNVCQQTASAILYWLALARLHECLCTYIFL